MAHTICGVCFSLNKSTSYLSLCLSLNSFCIETSRTWASLSLETKCETVGSSSNLSYMVSASGFIICLTEQRTHLPWNWKTQILSGKGYSKHKTTYIRLELSFKFEWLSPVKSLLMCEWKAREFRKASGEKNNPRSQQDFKRKLHFTSSHVCVCVCVCVCFRAHPRVCSESFQILCDPVDCSPPDSSVHEITQARTLEWVAISFFRGSSSSRDQIHISCVSCIDRHYCWANWSLIFT